MAMKWNRLPDKEPPFDTELLIWVDNDWKVATLTEIKSSGAGKIFVFAFAWDESTTQSATHWYIPEPPKNNQQ